jgi:Family of unknown function (DUF6599)
MKVAVTALAVLLSAGITGAQDYLNCSYAPGWQQTGTKRQYRANNLYDYKDGAAEGYLSFGFVRMVGISCKSGKNTLDIDVSEMSDPDTAYGIFTANADPRQPTAGIGMAGQVMRQNASFSKGVYYVEIVETATNPDGDDRAIIRAFAEGIEKHLEGLRSPPEVIQWFPSADRVSVRMIPESVLGLRELKRGYVARYKQGQAFIVREVSEESAAEVLKNLRGRFDSTVDVQVSDGGFQANTRYLGGVCIFRKGRFLAGYANLPTAEEAAALAQKFATDIP